MINKVQLEDVGCPLGCNRKEETILKGFDRISDLPGEFYIVKCCNCGLMRTNPRPSSETIEFYYPEDYLPYIDTRVQKKIPKRSGVVKRVMKGIVKKLIKFNTMNLPDMLPGRILEVGCASGAFLYDLKNKGWQVRGVEFSEKAAANASELGIKVYAGSLDSAPKPDINFDLIVGWMVLEHLHEPIQGLRKLRDWADPNAWLVLSIPNSGSIEFKIFKEKLYALHLPNHLYHFTPHTIDLVLTAGGWRLEKIFHQRTLSNMIGSLGYVLQDKGFVKLGYKFINFPNNSGKLPYLLFPFAWFLSLFGQTGRMTVWARVSK